jgi:hypothetical protein
MFHIFPYANKTSRYEVVSQTFLCCFQPARIRKKNRLFFDDDVINTMLPRSSPKRGPKGSPARKAASVAASATKVAALPVKKHHATAPQTESQHNDVHEGGASGSSVPTSPDRRVGQRIGMRLRNLLKLPKAHKWVCYEWFYSNIDK